MSAYFLVISLTALFFFSDRIFSFSFSCILKFSSLFSSSFSIFLFDAISSSAVFFWFSISSTALCRSDSSVSRRVCFKESIFSCCFTRSFNLSKDVFPPRPALISFTSLDFSSISSFSSFPRFFCN